MITAVTAEMTEHRLLCRDFLHTHTLAVPMTEGDYGVRGSYYYKDADGTIAFFTVHAPDASTKEVFAPEDRAWFKTSDDAQTAIKECFAACGDRPNQFKPNEKDRTKRVGAMSKNFIVAIDPGQTGAVAVLSLTGQAIYIAKAPIDFSALRAVLPPDAIVHPVIEKAQASPQMGVSSAFKYGRTYGEQLTLMAHYFGRPHEVPPSVWKPEMKLTRDKKLSVEMARPHVSDHLLFGKKLSHDEAEAVLLGLWYSKELGRIARNT